MHNLKISIGIFLALAASRFIPHPPNFTSLLALSFYIPVLFGIRCLPILVVSFILTDFIIGMHNVTLFTWGSIILIGLASKFFINTLSTRIFGSLLGACLFFIVTNFGVWSLGAYGYSLNSLMLCYTLALPFFAYTFISTFIFSGVIEGLYKFNFFKLKANK